MIDLYERIGVSKEASPDEIKKAYRAKAMETHPDHGGSPEKFGAIAKAYSILSDAEKRKRYDDGEDPEEMDSSPEDEAKKLILEFFLSAVDRADVDHQDIFRLVKGDIEKGIAGFKEAAQDTQKKIKKYESAMKRISVKKKSKNFLADSINAMIMEARKRKISLEKQVKVGEIALTILGDFEYSVDLQDIPSVRFTNPFYGSNFGIRTGLGGL